MPLLFICLLLCFESSIYNLSFQTSSGSNQSMSAFQGKKVLFVNIATSSSRVGQLAGLQQLQQQYGDSVTVIAFPSNSFGNESRSDSAILQFCQQNYSTQFMIASKAPISGASIQSVYHWLTSASENGVTSEPIKGDFQKMLVDHNGKLIGIFSPNVSPLSSELVSAILQ
jgi:glutathione peroxidase